MTLEEFLKANIHAIAIINFQYGNVQWAVGRIGGLTEYNTVAIKPDSLLPQFYIKLATITKVTILAPRNPDDPKYSFPFPK